MKKLVLKLSLLSIIVLTQLLAVDWLYRQRYHIHHQYLENFLPNSKIAEPYQIVKVGNSHPQAGITFKGYKMKSFDLTNAAQRFSFDLALLKQHRQEIAENAVIIINVSPMSFSHSTEDRDDGLQETYYGRISPFFIPHLKLGKYIQVSAMPFVRSGYLFRKNFTHELQKKVDLERSQPAAMTTPSQPVVAKEDYYLNVDSIQKELSTPTPTDPKKHVENMNFIFHKWYETDEFGQQYFDQNRKDLEALILYCQKNGWKPVLITMPVSEVLKDGLLDDYMQVYLYDNMQKTDLHGSEYIDFLNETKLTKNNFLFANADHLNEQGATVFSYLLLQELINKGYVSSEADGYEY